MPTASHPLKAIGWSIAFFASGMVLSVGLFMVLDALIPTQGDLLLAALVQAAGMLLAFGGMTWAIGMRGAGLSLDQLGWAPVRRGIPGFGGGMLLGFLPALLAMVAAVVAGGAAWQLDGGTVGSWLVTAGGTASVLLPAALAEEVVFRGVPLVLLARFFGRWRTAIGLSALFAAAHLFNPGITPLALVNIALAGVFLTACFYLPGGLWTATGAHLGWNLGLAGLAAPVSGLPLAMPLLDYHPGGPAWLTGGGFGPEGGVLATIIFIGATLWVAGRVRHGRLA